ncbi:Actin-like ATPase superfamily protein [Zea mays]|uniref:Actin-like ATPase superfamily protein n=1 Tax=Zea mays TaxID=4577 RepID=A0A1D6L5M9_MAIZE|nr:Actin-like ATPase superfamily protein [Zea mays]
MMLVYLKSNVGQRVLGQIEEREREREEMQRLTGRDMWDVEECQSPRMGSVILGVGGTSNTVCVCIPAAMPFNDPLPVLSRTVAGYSNHNSVGGTYFQAMSSCSWRTTRWRRWPVEPWASCTDVC